MDKISDIRLFTLVASEGSFSAAARRANLSPAMVTRRIAQLEESLAVRLFSRTTRAVNLTEAGLRFLNSADEIILAADQALDDIQNWQSVPRGTLRITASPFLGDSLVSAIPGFMTYTATGQYKNSGSTRRWWI